MSLLDSGRETITIYPEIQTVDSDGNIVTKPDHDNPIVTRASIQPQQSSGTSARRREQDQEGFLTESICRLRLPRRFPHLLGAQSRIEWNGEYWAVIGDAYKFNSSDRTRHRTYTIRRT